MSKYSGDNYEQKFAAKQGGQSDLGRVRWPRSLDERIGNRRAGGVGIVSGGGQEHRSRRAQLLRRV
eukprot:4435968-Pleurochrysis_carterae.AAC.1